MINKITKYINKLSRELNDDADILNVAYKNTDFPQDKLIAIIDRLVDIGDKKTDLITILMKQGEIKNDNKKGSMLFNKGERTHDK